MINTSVLKSHSGPLRILCIGAHSDDIEIGCGGTILQLAAAPDQVRVHWAVLSATGLRETEARDSAGRFAGTALASLYLEAFADGFMPYAGAEVKAFFEQTLKPIAPDLIFTHCRDDAHQDHRIVAELTWNTFRNHFILEYEIPKYDGDLGRPGIYVPLLDHARDSKVEMLMSCFATQRAKHWFQESTFLALMRLRGMECNSPSGYAEAFYARKILLNLTSQI